MSKLRTSLSFERRPRMLKDFLQDDHYINGQQQQQLLVRSRSKAAAGTISAIHKASSLVIKVIRFLPHSSSSAPSILPRSISRKLSKRDKAGKSHRKTDEGTINNKVKVKDILRWRSSRDLMEERSPPPPMDDLLHDYSPTSGSATTCTTTSCNSKRSSWCESDFTADDDDDCSSSSYGKKVVNVGKKFLIEESVGQDSPKGKLRIDENEQHSPVSVFDSPFQDNEYVLQSYYEDQYQRSLADMESKFAGKKCLVMQTIQEWENLAEVENRRSSSFGDEEDQVAKEVEELANLWVRQVKEKCMAKKKRSDCCRNQYWDDDEDEHDLVLMDFFMHELITNGELIKDGKKFESEMLRTAESWVSNEYDDSFDWEVPGNRVSYIKDMERSGGVKWNKFEQEREETSLELEAEVLSDLLDELLADL